MKKPLVSIIIPTYNSAKTIDNCLRSIFTQTYLNTEVIIVDNQSTDWTVNKASKYSVDIYVLKGSRSTARAFGVNKSKGKFLLFIDSDQVLSESLITNLVQMTEKFGFKAMAIPERTANNIGLSKYYSAERMCVETFGLGIPRFFDREFYKATKGYPEITFGEDQWLLNEITKRSEHPIGLAKCPVYHYDPENLPDLMRKYRMYGASFRSYFGKSLFTNFKMICIPFYVLFKIRNIKLSIGVTAIKLIKFFAFLLK